MNPFNVSMAAALILTTVCAIAQPDAPQVFRVMSYNIHHGRGLDGKVDLDRIAGLIKREGADIVALQEVDRNVERTDRRDLPAELARLTGMHCFFERNIPYQGGDYGNAVLTRFPILQQTNTHLRMMHANEQRGVIQLVLDVHGRHLLFMNTHIDFRQDDSERLGNVEQFAEILSQAPRLPVVFCGDFNSLPGSRTHTRMKELLADSWERAGEGDGFTFPAGQPSRRIDYIWISRETIEPLKLWVPATEASDHLPVVAELQMKR